MFRTKLVEIFLSTLLCTALHAQWAPITAQIRETSRTIKSDQVIRSQVREGVFYRTSNGSTLTHWLRVDGADVSGTGNLLDNQQRLTYKLDYATRQATQSAFSLPEPLRPNMYSKIAPIGLSVVSGIPCKLIPVELQFPGGQASKIGQACVSAEYGLLLKQETSVSAKDLSRTEVVTEMYQVKIGTEPAAAEFDVTANFTVSRPERTTNAPPPTQ